MLYDLHERLQAHLDNQYFWNAMLDSQVSDVCDLRREHPSIIREFVLSLYCSISLSLEEKKQILRKSNKISTEQINELCSIFRNERRKFDVLIRRDIEKTSLRACRYIECHRFPTMIGPETKKLGMLLQAWLRVVPTEIAHLKKQYKSLEKTTDKSRLPALLELTKQCYKELYDEVKKNNACPHQITTIASYLTRIGGELEKDHPTVEIGLVSEVKSLAAVLNQLENLCSENTQAMQALVLMKIKYKPKTPCHRSLDAMIFSDQ